jgi:uncharacterized membrane protein
MTDAPGSLQRVVKASSSTNRRTTSSVRVEAFSDAVLAITITLLVTEIRRPEIGEEALASALLHRWPEYVAVAVSFLYVGVIWLNHHSLFTRIRDVDVRLNWINVGALATAALVPVPTGVLAAALADGSRADRQAAVGLYAGVGVLASAACSLSSRTCTDIRSFSSTPPTRTAFSRSGCGR